MQLLTKPSHQIVLLRQHRLQVEKLGAALYASARLSAQGIALGNELSVRILRPLQIKYQRVTASALRLVSQLVRSPQLLAQHINLSSAANGANAQIMS